MASNDLKPSPKLKITAYKDSNFSQQVGQPLEVSVNPEKYKRSYKPLTTEEPVTILANGERRDELIVDPPPEVFQLELWFDGTGAIAGSKDVYEDIEALKTIALLYDGDIHSNHFVKLEWGGEQGLVFKGQLQSLDIDYELFNREGKPLRARANVTFIQFIDPKTRESLKNKSSPDLTHIRTVQDGDSLPLMCYRIYRDPSWYLQVAEVNGLENVMDLQPGQQIVFPPLKK